MNFYQIVIWILFFCCMVFLGTIEVEKVKNLKFFLGNRQQECPEPISGPDANYDGLDDCIVPVVSTTATVRGLGNLSEIFLGGCLVIPPSQDEILAKNTGLGFPKIANKKMDYL